MPILDCTHESTVPANEVCRHLTEAPDSDYSQVFTGVGQTYRLACPNCVEELQSAAIRWLSVCDSCFHKIESDGCWLGVAGTPEIREQISELHFTHRAIAWDNPLRTVAPISASARSEWIGLTTDGRLLEFDLDNHAHRLIADVSAFDIDVSAHVTLICDPAGDYLCLTQTLGSAGIVIERQTDNCTMVLKREGPFIELTPFPSAFFVHGERTLLLHATAWNRLDISDPANGALLTDRTIETFQIGRPRSAHCLDYFHGRLTISPSQDKVVDDGWHRYPSGIPRAWSLRQWLDANIWESENGPSITRLAVRSFFWGGPMCWIDDHTVAVWGYGREEEWLLPAVLIVDAGSGKRRNWFPISHAKRSTLTDSQNKYADFGVRFVFDTYLFVISISEGVSIWNPETGHRLFHDYSFAPVAFHPGSREFLTIRQDGGLQLSRLAQPSEDALP